MQFVNKGPDIPERLLQSHEDGNVVFFCGAGISYSAALPDFKKLTYDLYKRLDWPPNPVQKAALEANDYDTAIGLLEKEHVGGRKVVRREIANILLDTYMSSDSIATHEALLRLGRCQAGKFHLITTNYDRIFENVMNCDNELKVPTFIAPLLPIPKTRWNGLIYLHGLISEPPTDEELDSLVVTSGDFGLAYLTERWAARFVSELFRNYTVCFIGYSLNDPVLKYMVDALSADNQRGENCREMFTFDCYKKGEKNKRETEWLARNITPILYPKLRNHFYLHKTLHHWASMYHDGLRGKEQIVIRYANSIPSMTTKQDNFVDIVIWALSDPRGLPVKRFAEFNPTPPLGWLKIFADKIYNDNDLLRFGVSPYPTKDKLYFNILKRPAPYNKSPWMSLVNFGNKSVKIDIIMRYLGIWLTKYLDEPDLILWLVKQGGCLNDDFIGIITTQLKEIERLETNGNEDKLKIIRSQSPHSIPRAQMRTLWRLFLLGFIKNRSTSLDIYQWKDRFLHDGMTSSLRIALRTLLTPCVELKEPFRFSGGIKKEQTMHNFKEIVDWDIALRADHVYAALVDLQKKQLWQEALSTLVNDFSILLNDVLELMQELGGASKYRDLSYIHQPSISEHSQNKYYRDWTVLIKLTRDSWLSLSEKSKDQARVFAHQWFSIPYPLFKRLAFFAASQKDIIETEQAIEWLLSDQSWWLWSNETKRETMRLLVKLSPELKPNSLIRIESAILAGPPRDMFIVDIDPTRWEQIVDREVWFRLKKLETEGVELNGKAKSKLKTLSVKYPKWQMAANEMDELAFYITDGKELNKFNATPRRRRDLIKWLKENPDSDDWQEDDWQKRCRDEFITSAYALCKLSREDIWPVGRWREALDAWSEEQLAIKSWHYMAQILIDAPLKTFSVLSQDISWWLRNISKYPLNEQQLFITICKRIISIEHQNGVDSDDPVTLAFNHPIGHITEALLNLWFSKAPDDNQYLPIDIGKIFSDFCNAQIPSYLNARVLLASHTIPLFRVDPDWTKRNLLPLFDWKKSKTDARFTWCGLLMHPRYYRPLFELIKPMFLDTATNYERLGEYGPLYASLVSFIALDSKDAFTRTELKAVIGILPEAGMIESLQVVLQALDSSGNKKKEYWCNRIQPFFANIWPKSYKHKTEAVTEVIARICVSNREVFPEALKTLKPWLQPINNIDFVINKIKSEELAKLYPEGVLEFMDAIIVSSPHWKPLYLQDILEQIKANDQKIEKDTRFIRLQNILYAFVRTDH